MSIIFRGLDEMNRTVKLARVASVFVIGMSLVASQAHASSVTLTFNQLRNGTFIQNYFDGGLSSYAPSGDGPNDGVVFSGNADELKQGFNGTAPSGGAGKFENNPSSLNGVLYFTYSSTTTSYLNDAAGFTALSFGYSLLNNLSTYDDTVELFSGLNGTGTLLGSLLLSPNGTAVACATSPSTSTSGPSAKDEFCTWSAASASNFGDAQSISFGGTSSTPLEGIEFDDIQLTSTPLPGAFPLFATGLGALGLLGWRRKRKAQAA